MYHGPLHARPCSEGNACTFSGLCAQGVLFCFGIFFFLSAMYRVPCFRTLRYILIIRFFFSSTRHELCYIAYGVPSTLITMFIWKRPFCHNRTYYYHTGFQLTERSAWLSVCTKYVCTMYVYHPCRCLRWLGSDSDSDLGSGVVFGMGSLRRR
jgi:hypothetical protein